MSSSVLWQTSSVAEEVHIEGVDVDFVDAYAAIRGHKVFVAIKRWTPHSHSNGDDAESSEEDLDGADPADLQQGGGVLVDVGPDGDVAGCSS